MDAVSDDQPTAAALASNAAALAEIRRHGTAATAAQAPCWRMPIVAYQAHMSNTRWYRCRNEICVKFLRMTMKAVSSSSRYL